MRLSCPPLLVRFTLARAHLSLSSRLQNSVFVEFASADDAEKFLALDPKPQYKGNELLTMSKYVASSRSFELALPSHCC